MSVILKPGPLFLISLLFFTACQKKPVIVPQPEEPKCKIIQCTYEQSGGAIFGINTARIYYNAAGNPDSALMSRPFEGNSSVYFKYDKYNRLSDFIAYFNIRFDTTGEISFCFFEEWRRYVYADNNPTSLPTGDTVRSINGYQNGEFARFGGLYTGKYQFDPQGRVVRYDATISNANRIFTYDANGNRVGDTYDSKKNYRGGNKALMLIDMDYSVNNSIAATAYNAEGYPTSFPAKIPGQPRHTFFLRRTVEFFSMDYSCTGVKAN